MPDAHAPAAQAAATKLAVDAVAKGYAVGDARLAVLTDVSLAVAAAEMVAVMGPSGAGKTTLLNCISGIDVPDAGTVTVAGEAVDYADEGTTTRLRRRHVGMVFQFFNLIPSLTVSENVALPLLIGGADDADAAERAGAMIERIGIGGRRGHYPFQLSGGEMQLVSIARALVIEPAVVLADEPTGNVNPTIGRAIMDTLRQTTAERGAALLMATHSPEHAAQADRVLFLKDGVIADELSQRGHAGDAAPVYDRLQALAI